MSDVPQWQEATLCLANAQKRAAIDPTSADSISQDMWLPLPVLEHIDRVCLEFEDAWIRGERPRVEQFCGDAPEAERLPLLHQLLLVELDYKFRSGETLNQSEYHTRFPDGRELIDEVFRPYVLREAATAGAEPRRFADYDLLEEIARGGMGVVYKARQASLNRIVALKMILAGQLASEKQVRRFHAEAAAAAKLDHPGIVPIYEVGEHQGQHFFSMGFIEGESLDARIARAPLEPRKAAQLLQAVAEAVQYAHEKGVIHRDLKPANILLDNAGHPRITDFGLARPVAGHSGLTASGEIVGTPSYMPPEQAAGKLDEIGPASDVYALGAVLYALLTGRPPFQAPNPLDTLLQVLEQEPITPRRRNPHVPKDLETICLKALEKNPDRRYRTAGAMAADLGRYLSGFAISARRVGPVGRMIRWVKRRRAVAASLFGILVLGLVAAFFAYQFVRERRQHAIDNALAWIWVGEFGKAEEAIDEAQRWGATRGWVHMLRGQLALHLGDTDQALYHLNEAKELLPDSAAAWAMLAVAYWQDAKFEQCQDTLDVLDKLPPVTPEDYLFKGYAQATIDPGRGLDGIDKAIELRRNWTIAHALGAEVRSWVAQDRTDPDLVKLALEDAQIVKKMLLGKPKGLEVSLYANLVAATIYKKKGDADNEKKALAKAEVDADGLEALPPSGWSVFMRYRYKEYIDKDDEALQEVERARLNKVKSPWPATLYALGLYREGRFEDALKALEGLDKNDMGAFQQTTRMFILAELPEGDKRAMQAYRDLGRYPGTAPLFQHTLLYLLGRKAEAVAAYRELQLPNFLAEARDGSYAQLLEYNCARGRMTAEELLSAGKGSEYHQCNAHFFIAMSLLADGNRAAARDHFQKCVQTRCFDFDAYDWSRMFLARMKQDPGWPRFLSPRKQAAAQPSPQSSPKKGRVGRPAKM